MKISKTSSEELEDRLSDLPDPIIFEIFSLLPMRDFVRTTILSKRWKNLWTTTPYLNFRGHAPEFVNRALILWKGFKILKFKFGLGGLFNESMVSDFDMWVRLAKDCGVEVFYFDNAFPRYLHEHHPSTYYCLPHNLYSCTSLKKLLLEDCRLQIHGNAHLNQLKSLQIKRCILDEHWINHVVSGSPQLELFTLYLSFPNESLSIRSTSLKHLLIERHFDDFEDEEPELRIWSPNLETLHLGGVPYAKYSLMNVSSLTDVTLDFLYEYYGYVFLEDIIWQIFPALQHVENLSFSESCIQALGDMKQKYLLSPLSNCKVLTMNGSDAQYGEIVDILHIFPKLETLFLLFDYYSSEDEDRTTSFLQAERNLPKSILLHLRTVEITYDAHDNLIFPFVGVLLKHASKLQKMVIRVEGIEPPSMPLCLALQQKLLTIPRSSPTAELILTEY